MTKPKPKKPKKTPEQRTADYTQEALERLLDALFTGPCPLTEAGFHVE